MPSVHNYIVPIYTDYAIEIFLEELKKNFSTKFFDFIKNLNKIVAKRDTPMSQSPISKDENITVLIIANSFFGLYIKNKEFL